MLPLVYVWNQSTLASDDDAQAATAAIQKQVTFHFAQHWGGAILHFIPKSGRPPQDAWIIRLVDDVGLAGALGYHEGGEVPSGIVGVKACIDDRVSWSSCLSHEVLEMVADPECCRCFQIHNHVVSLEVCDAVEGIGYRIDGVEVSNFNTPAYFCGGFGPWDFLGHLQDCYPALEVGGYSTAARIGEWTQENAEQVRASKLTAGAGSRRSRRGAGR